MVQRKTGFSKLELVTGLIGVLPIPIAGEICGTKFFYDVIKTTPFVDKMEKSHKILMAAAITGLVRMSMYGEMYAQMFNYLSKH